MIQIELSVEAAGCAADRFVAELEELL